MRMSDWSSDGCSSDLAVLQFIGRDPQHGTLDLLDFLDAAIEERLQRGVAFAPVLFDPAHQVLEVIEVGHFVRLLVRELRDRVLRVGAGDLHGVHRLQRAAARARTRCVVDSVPAAVVTAHGSLPSRLAISSATRSEEHTSELQSLMRISYAVFCLKKKNSIT